MEAVKLCGEGNLVTCVVLWLPRKETHVRGMLIRTLLLTKKYLLDKKLYIYLLLLETHTCHITPLLW